MGVDGYMACALAKGATRTPGNQKATPSAHWNQPNHSDNDLFIHSGFTVLLRDAVVRIAGTLTFWAPASLPNL